MKKNIKDIMLHALCVVYVQGNHGLHAATEKAAEAIQMLGTEADIRETTDDQYAAVRLHIKHGTIRISDTHWTYLEADRALKLLI